jgi:DNA mismatch endonuclease, patch repair protein
MRRVRSRDTTPERRLRSALHRRGLRFRVDVPLPGLRRRRADVAFSRAQVAIFVHGCFWHGCPEHGSLPRNNRDLWRAKIERTTRRDRETADHLTAAGWTPVIVWEHDDVELVATQVERLVRATA